MLNKEWSFCIRDYIKEWIIYFFKVMKGILNSFVCNKDFNKFDNFLGKVLLYLGFYFFVKINFNGVCVI